MKICRLWRQCVELPSCPFLVISVPASTLWVPRPLPPSLLPPLELALALSTMPQDPLPPPPPVFPAPSLWVQFQWFSGPGRAAALGPSRLAPFLHLRSPGWAPCCARPLRTPCPPLLVRWADADDATTECHVRKVDGFTLAPVRMCCQTHWCLCLVCAF